jgi:hypothetical protein
MKMDDHKGAIAVAAEEELVGVQVPASLHPIRLTHHRHVNVIAAIWIWTSIPMTWEAKARLGVSCTLRLCLRIGVQNGTIVATHAEAATYKTTGWGRRSSIEHHEVSPGSTFLLQRCFLRDFQVRTIFL